MARPIFHKALYFNTYIQTNKSLASGIFPKPWKEATISPIFKNGSKDDVNNYRPISILPTLSKIIKKWIQKHLMLFLNNHNLLYEKQIGFREGHCTESALILMIDSWLKAIHDGKFVWCLMVDFRKAFDLVDHGILLQKLKSINVMKVVYHGLELKSHHANRTTN